MVNFFQNKQLLFKVMYSLKLIKLKMLKIYIESNLVNEFIKFFKSFFKALILFIYKKNNNFYLYISY